MAYKTLHLNDVDLNVFDDGRGEPVVLLHGFPDSSKLWRHQIPALLQRGYRVIAPDLRGFGESTKPDALASYAIGLHVADVLAILDELSIPSAHLVGHDWGALIAWLVAGMAPKRTQSLSALSVGHPQSFANAGLEQREKSWYMLLFQFEDLAEQLLRENNWKLFREFVRNHDELENWLADLERPHALTSAINIYRANAHPKQSFSAHPFPRVGARTLGIWGSDDHYLTEGQMIGSKTYVDGAWHYERLVGAGHWLQLDQSDAVNELLIDFLKP